MCTQTGAMKAKFSKPTTPPQTLMGLRNRLLPWWIELFCLCNVFSTYQKVPAIFSPLYARQDEWPSVAIV